MSDCPHKRVLVDFRHNWGDFPGQEVSFLQARASDTPRPYMTLDNPRCADCGKALSRNALRERIRPGGDLYHPRFRWSLDRKLR